MNARLKGGTKLATRLAELQRAATSARKVDVGFFEDATYPDGTPVAMIAAAQEFGTDKIPARSFMRTTIADRQKDWGKAAAAVLKATGCNARQALEQLGATASNDIQQKIRAITAPPLVPSTIRQRIRKKSRMPEKPLIDTGQMVQSVRWQVDDGQAPVSGKPAQPRPSRPRPGSARQHQGRKSHDEP